MSRTPAECRCTRCEHPAHRLSVGERMDAADAYARWRLSATSETFQ